MQVLIAHGHVAQSRVVRLGRLQIVAAMLYMAVLLLLFSGALYLFTILEAARDGPVVSQVLHLVVRDGIAQCDRFMRENLDAMASKLGELWARLAKPETMGQRMSGLAGVRADELMPL